LVCIVSAAYLPRSGKKGGITFLNISLNLNTFIKNVFYFISVT